MPRKTGGSAADYGEAAVISGTGQKQSGLAIVLLVLGALLVPAALLVVESSYGGSLLWFAVGVACAPRLVELIGIAVTRGRFGPFHTDGWMIVRILLDPAIVLSTLLMPTFATYPRIFLIGALAVGALPSMIGTVLSRGRRGFTRSGRLSEPGGVDGSNTEERLHQAVVPSGGEATESSRKLIKHPWGLAVSLLVLSADAIGLYAGLIVLPVSMVIISGAVAISLGAALAVLSVVSAPKWSLTPFRPMMMFVVVGFGLALAFPVLPILTLVATRGRP